MWGVGRRGDENDVGVVKLLVVDDDPVGIELMTIAATLHDPPCAVEAVETGEAALELLRRLRNPKRASLPDAVLLDLRVPGPPGLDVLEGLRSDAQLRDLVVIVVTTSTRAEDEARARAAGINGYLAKPHDLAGFERIIADVVALVGRHRSR